MGNYQIFLILVQKPVRATPLKVHNFKKIQGAKNKKIKKNFVEKSVFFNAYIILEDNQIFLKKHFFDLFLFSKKGTFSKNKFCLALIVEKHFLEFHTGI